MYEIEFVDDWVTDYPGFNLIQLSFADYSLDKSFNFRVLGFGFTIMYTKKIIYEKRLESFFTNHIAMYIASNNNLL